MEYENYKTIRFERKERVLTVVLDNPDSPHNACDGPMHEELGRLFRDLRGEREARAIVLTADPAKEAFCAPSPPEALLMLSKVGVAGVTMGREVARGMIWDLLEVEVPIIAAINGDAISLGGLLALLCDTVFMAEDAVVRDPHVELGVVAGDGAAVLWPLVVGPTVAKRHLLSGDPLKAEDAYRLGLATDICPADQVIPQATAFAERVAAMPPLAAKYTKMTVNKLVKDAMSSAFELGLAHELITFMSEDMVEAITAEREGRKPDFQGR